MSPAPAPRLSIEGPDNEARALSALLPDALAHVHARGLALARPTRVVAHGDRGSFVAATGTSDPDLRAWTRHDVIHLMPLVSWARQDRTRMSARLAHELCHAAIHQALGEADAAQRARIPRVLEEGMCSVVAGQGDERMDLRAALIGLEDVPSPQAFTIDFFARDPARAYALAHHAAALLETRHGPGLWAQLLARAAHDKEPGCMERALYDVTSLTLADLWRALRESTTPAPAGRGASSMNPLRISGRRH